MSFSCEDALAPVILLCCVCQVCVCPCPASSGGTVIIVPLMHLTTLYISSGIPSIRLMGQQGAAGQSSLVYTASVCSLCIFVQSCVVLAIVMLGHLPLSVCSFCQKVYLIPNSCLHQRVFTYLLYVCVICNRCMYCRLMCACVRVCRCR